VAEFVRKNMLGGYKVVPGGESDPLCTHVILTKAEYSEFLKEEAGLRTSVQDERRRADATKEEADRKIAEAQKEAAREIDQVRKEMAVVQSALDDEVELNINLKRIAKERANADRHLKPKKEHTGYVVVSSMEKAYRYRSGRGTEVVSLWETVVQTPYEIGFSEEVARKQILEELRNEIMRDIGIEVFSSKRYEELVFLKEWRQTLVNYNVMMDARMKGNYRAGYWEVVFLHTYPLGQVPKDMMSKYYK